MLSKKITIVVRGDTDHDIELATEEAMRLVGEGYSTGANSNDSGAFYFRTVNDLPRGELPA